MGGGGAAQGLVGGGSAAQGLVGGYMYLKQQQYTAGHNKYKSYISYLVILLDIRNSWKYMNHVSPHKALSDMKSSGRYRYHVFLLIQGQYLRYTFKSTQTCLN